MTSGPTSIPKPSDEAREGEHSLAPLVRLLARQAAREAFAAASDEKEIPDADPAREAP